MKHIAEGVFSDIQQHPDLDTQFPEILYQFVRPYCLSGKRVACTRKDFRCYMNVSHLKMPWNA